MTDPLNTNRDESYDRPPIVVDWDSKTVTFRASALMNCRRRWFYHATQTDQPEWPMDEVEPVDQFIMDTGNALEGAVLNAMDRGGWLVNSIVDMPNDGFLEMEIGTFGEWRLIVNGHPDAWGLMPDERWEQYVAVHDPKDLTMPETIIEVKTRNHSEYRKWENLGLARSHPEAAVQLAFYTYALFREWNEGVVATMDVSERTWDYEILTPRQLSESWNKAVSRINGFMETLTKVPEHYGDNKAFDKDFIPEQDYVQGHYMCSSCPFRTECWKDRVEETPKVSGLYVDEEEMAEAIIAWRRAHNGIAELQYEKDDAITVAYRFLKSRGITSKRVNGKLVKFQYKTNYGFNRKLFHEMFTEDERGDIETVSVSTSTRIYV